MAEGSRSKAAIGASNCGLAIKVSSDGEVFFRRQGACRRVTGSRESDPSKNGRTRRSRREVPVPSRRWISPGVNAALKVNAAPRLVVIVLANDDPSAVETLAGKIRTRN